ncbi:uncharacterized protein LOC143206802 isoform X3 [Rhynchophorus ferrugineus]|uniref:uncharacterized protein LOC143206802 isoform X3 n=1 Tax=Rhynchophorus ferrugineus TaxID=354439 RepID=UPI003FCCACE4
MLKIICAFLFISSHWKGICMCLKDCVLEFKLQELNMKNPVYLLLTTVKQEMDVELGGMLKQHLKQNCTLQVTQDSIVL